MAKARAITGLDLQAPTGRNARLIVRERLADMYAFTDYIGNPEHIQQLHDLRIAAKRVRYTLEVFAEYLPVSSKYYVEELSALQEELGDLHDSEVMLGLLRLLLKTEQDGLESGPEEADPSAEEKPLFPSEMEYSLLASALLSPLNDHQHVGLASFLHRQEQRREQAYAAFRRHWEDLERRLFHAELLTMLESTTER